MDVFLSLIAFGCLFMFFYSLILEILEAECTTKSLLISLRTILAPRIHLEHQPEEILRSCDLPENVFFFLFQDSFCLFRYFKIWNESSGFVCMNISFAGSISVIAFVSTVPSSCCIHPKLFLYDDLNGDLDDLCVYCMWACSLSSRWPLNPLRSKIAIQHPEGETKVKSCIKKRFTVR